MIQQIDELLRQQKIANDFSPYVEIDEQADALTAYFKSDADYSKRLSDHVTLYLSLETDELVGCRIKGVQGILADLPNFVTVDHDGVQLSILFLPYLSSATQEERATLNELARASRDMRVPVAS